MRADGVCALRAHDDELLSAVPFAAAVPSLYSRARSNTNVPLVGIDNLIFTHDAISSDSLCTDDMDDNGLWRTV
jgi:hypothetical protein